MWRWMSGTGKGRFDREEKRNRNGIKSKISSRS
jgi:hypothetical protein